LKPLLQHGVTFFASLFESGDTTFRVLGGPRWVLWRATNQIISLPVLLGCSTHRSSDTAVNNVPVAHSLLESSGWLCRIAWGRRLFNTDLPPSRVLHAWTFSEWSCAFSFVARDTSRPRAEGQVGRLVNRSVSSCPCTPQARSVSCPPSRFTFMTYNA